MATSKKRSYNKAFLQWGFTSICDKSVEKPQCVICLKVLTAESMKPSKLKDHFERCHGELKEKDIAYFERKERSLKSTRIDSGGQYARQNESALRASYAISLHIARNKKAHTIGEDLVKPCLIEATRLVLGEEQAKKMKQIPLSNDTVKRRIAEMSSDILEQVITELKSSPSFAIQLDESTDVSSCSQLLVYARYMKGLSVKEEYLFSEPLATTTRGKDVFEIVDKFFKDKGIDWTKVAGICTDGAPSMTGVHSGFQACVRNIAPHVQFTHCMLHRHALAMKTLPNDLADVLSDVVKIVNHIRGSALNSRIFKTLCQEMGGSHTVLLFHTEVRWLSRGKVLHRFLELKEEIATFLERKKTAKEVNLLEKMKSEEFMLKVAYLADFFGEVNSLNLSIQGNNVNVLGTQDKVAAFQRKIQLYQRRVQAGDTIVFSELTALLTSIGEECSFVDLIEEHLSLMIETISSYFPDLDRRGKKAWVTKPFTVDEEVIEDSDTAAKLEFLALREDKTLEVDYHYQNKELTTFWAKLEKEYHILSQRALNVLIPFATTYRCEAGFSALVCIKTKARNQLKDADADMRCALSSTDPRIDILLKDKQYHVSH